MTIETQNAIYLEKLPLIQQTRAAIGGKADILCMIAGCLPNPLYRKTATNYAQVSERIDNYWLRARYYNATGRTHEALNGMLWSKEPIDERPSALDYNDTNADGAGNSLRDVATEITSDLTGVGRYGSLVDMPSGESGTIEENESGMFAPHIINYRPEQIFYVRESSGNSGKMLAEIRLYETYEVQQNELTWETKKQIRRLVILDGVYHNQIWREGELYEDVTPIASGKTLSFITFYFFGADDNTSNFGKIPLFDLGSVNLGHFTLDADNRDNLHYHGQGMTNVFSSMDVDDFNTANPNGLDVGAKGKNMFGVEDRVEILQLEATGAIAAEMLRDEQRMIGLGAQVVQDVNTNVTLGAKEMEFGASTSTLKQISLNASRGIEQLERWQLMFLGDTASDVIYKINTDFITDDVTPEMVNAHMALVQGGQLPLTTIFETSRKAGLTDKDDETLKNDLGEQAMGITGTSEETATLMAERDALKEELAALKAGE